MSVIVLMGVAGSGKTTVGRIVAERLGWRFLDADDFHSPENVEKMRRGQPLTDDDRWPWLDRLNGLLREDGSAVLACSALRQRYRDRIGAGLDDVRWVHLAGSFELIGSRLAARKGHYMPASLLASQFNTLEPPSAALTIDVGDTPEVLAVRILKELDTRLRD
ncbi:MAG: gluconokinase [Burkholderiales bacterium]|nr:gluconokinase [Burkholderiales bacterium]